MTAGIISLLTVLAVQIACLVILRAHFKDCNSEVFWFDAGCRRISAWLVSDRAESLPVMIGLGMIAVSVVMLLLVSWQISVSD